MDNASSLQFKNSDLDPFHPQIFGYPLLFPYETTELFLFIVGGLCLTILGIFGIIGNFLSSLVLFKRARKSAFASTIFGLALSDLTFCVIITFGFGVFVICYHLRVGDWYVEWVCKWISTYPLWIDLVGLSGSHYFTVLATLERLTAVVFPYFHRKRTIFTPFGILILASCILLGMGVYHGMNLRNELFLADPPQDADRENCRILSNHGSDTVMEGLQLSSYVVLMFIIPVATVVGGNAVIIVTIMKQRCLRKQSFASDRSTLPFPNSEADANLSKATNVLLAIVLIYVLSNSARIPRYVVRTPYIEVVVINKVLLVINSASNFVIYCVVGGEYRRDLIRLLCCKQ